MSSTSITKNIQGVEELIDYQFTNRNLISEALLAAGSYLPDISFSTDENKNLALVGDAVLKLVLVLHGYNKNNSKRAIGDALAVKSSNLYLAEKGFLNKLERFIFKNPSQGNIVSSGLMATTVEAILGAVYIDSGKNISKLCGVMNILDLSDPEAVFDV